MRKLLLLCGLVLLSSVASFAQSGISTIAAPSPAAALPAPPQAPRPQLTDWQLSIGYQFSRFSMPLQSIKGNAVPAFTVNDNGLDASITRFFLSWGGLEGAAAAGFGSGSTPQISSATSVFIGGGPHFAIRGRGRYEPWFHVLVGLEHFRFSQTAVDYGSNNSVGFIGGGGVDMHLNERAALRAHFDYLGTALFSRSQSNFQVGAGVVFSF
jgi:hypothetical protein